MKVFLNKKGAITDPIFVGIFILATAMTIFIALYFWSGFSTAILTTTANSNSNVTINQTITELTEAYGTIDYMIPMLVGGLMIVSLVFAFMTGASIIYAVLSLILWVFSLLMSAVFTNVFIQFESVFPAIALQVPILVYVMHNMKWVILIWLFLISTIMFSRNKSEEEKIKNNMIEGYYG